MRGPSLCFHREIRKIIEELSSKLQLLESCHGFCYCLVELLIRRVCDENSEILLLKVNSTIFRENNSAIFVSPVISSSETCYFSSVVGVSGVNFCRVFALSSVL